MESYGWSAACSAARPMSSTAPLLSQRPCRPTMILDAALLHVHQQGRLVVDQGLACQTFDELVPRYHADIRAGPLYDSGDDSH